MRIELSNLDPKKCQDFLVRDIIKVNFEKKCLDCVLVDNPKEVTSIEIKPNDDVFIYS